MIPEDADRYSDLLDFAFLLHRVGEPLTLIGAAELMGEGYILEDLDPETEEALFGQS